MGRRELWTGAAPGHNPFALPRGTLGRLAGWVMARSNRAQNIEVLDFLGLTGTERVLEVGHGPGVLAGLMARSGATVVGVDPSAEMVRMARRRNGAAVREGRLRLRQGTACDTGAEDESVDVVVSTNNVAMWPRLDDGAVELHRILRPGGRAVVTWHRRPARFALTCGQLERVGTALRARFRTVERTELRGSVVFTAYR